MTAPWVPGILQRAAAIGLRLTATNRVLSYEVPTHLIANTDVIELLWDIGQAKDDVIDAITQGERQCGHEVRADWLQGPLLRCQMARSGVICVP